MINSSKLPDQPFLTAKFFFQEFFGNEDMSDIEFIEKGMRAWKKMRLMPSEHYIFNAKVSGDTDGTEPGTPNNIDNFNRNTALTVDDIIYNNNRIIRLPKNCMWVEAVSTGTAIQDQYGDIVQVYSNNQDIGYKSYIGQILAGGEGMARDKLQSTPALTPSGALLSYTIKTDNDGMYIELMDDSFNGYNIQVLFKGIMHDSDGWPMITEAQAEGIATYVAYIEARREMMLNVPNAQNKVQFLKAEAGRAIQAAAIPENITQNEWDAILNAKTSFDRKQFNFSWIPIK